MHSSALQLARYGPAFNPVRLIRIYSAGCRKLTRVGRVELWRSKTEIEINRERVTERDGSGACAESLNKSCKFVYTASNLIFFV